MNYQQSVDLLNQKIQALEAGNVSLEEAVSLYEEARVLLESCQRQLNDAKMRVSMIQTKGQLGEEPFQGADE